MKDSVRYAFITGRSFKALVTRLIKEYRVYGTVEKDGFPAFGEIRVFEDLKLLMTPTHLSAKEFLFPPRETLLKLDIEKNTHEPVIEKEKRVIIGLHPCDIHAIALMDRVFSYGSADINYLARRNNTILIGTDCLPDRFCFCSSVGTMHADSGFDIFIHALKKGYLARTGSKAGEGLLNRVASRPANDRELNELSESTKNREGSLSTRLEADWRDLPAIYEKSDDSPVWERIGAICYGCGSCNNVCPTCYCFDVRDEVRADLKEGERVRVWDGCTLEDFAKVAGGHSFRKTRAERLRHRFNRKFRYLSGRFGSLFCVGCGRCSRTCLVRINIAEVTNELIREHDKK